ncbi:MAG: hypothetical protein LUQ65_06665 [Candidatus Helarchaeota archaeon]|nr:hypothetical protein [Candidatus Helarchaeota archaeon]
MNYKINFKDLLLTSRIVGELNTELTPEIAASLGVAFGTTFTDRGAITVARDFRPECRMLKRAFDAGVMSAGLNIMDLTAAPIPVLQYSIRRFGTLGGAILTTHHSIYTDKIEVKLYDRSGIEYDILKIKELLEICENGNFRRSKMGEIGNLTQTLEVHDLYGRAISHFIDTSLFNKLGLRVVADCSNGPMGNIIPSLLTRIGVDVIALNSYASTQRGLPSLNSLQKLSKVISSTDATFGVCFDVDGSRAIFFDERGNYISSDTVLALFVKHQLEQKNARVFVTTETTTTLLEKLISEYPDRELIRVKNIPGTVANTMRIRRADFGGSDTGKYRFPEYAYFSDTALATLKLLEMIAKSGHSLTELLREIPPSTMTQHELTVSPELLDNFNEVLERSLGNLKVIDTIIGLKIFFGSESGWIEVLPSFHEKKLILRGEIVNPAKSAEMFKTIEYALEGKIKSPMKKSEI